MITVTTHKHQESPFKHSKTIYVFTSEGFLHMFTFIVVIGIDVGVVWPSPILSRMLGLVLPMNHWDPPSFHSPANKEAYRVWILAHAPKVICHLQCLGLNQFCGLFCWKLRRKNFSQLFWVEPKQWTHWEMVEAIVWHTHLRWIRFECKFNLKSMEFQFHSMYFNSIQVLWNVIQYHNTWLYNKLFFI
jgi:hypothetical protein